MKEIDEKECINIAKHAIGLDYKKPYTRHGRKFYKPYRNYFCTNKDDFVWVYLKELEYAEHGEIRIISNKKICNYYLTKKGLDWLGEVLQIHIYDE